MVRRKNNFIIGLSHTLRLTKRTLTLLLAGAAIFLCPHVTQTNASEGEGIYKFSVLLYYKPVLVSVWKPDLKESSNPEGAALNIAAAMQAGDVDQWLAAWSPAERPKLSQAERDALLEIWKPLKNGQIYMVGRVVADLDIIIEVSVSGAQQPTQIIKLPLTHIQGQWCLTQMDPKNEFMDWENSPNKTVGKMRADMLKRYLKNLQAHY